MAQDDAAFWGSRPTILGRVSARQVEQERVVLNLVSGDFFSLNEVGTFVWDRIDGRRPVSDLLAAILAEYDVDEATASADLRELIDQLVAEGAIELRSEQKPAGQAG
ncbi:MAG: hypothetical protein BIFFINMI_03917 [Phycisphaerae bacterium]|nr:hypothetical protein [Phycisphaerae bacterium]